MCERQSVLGKLVVVANASCDYVKTKIVQSLVVNAATLKWALCFKGNFL